MTYLNFSVICAFIVALVATLVTIVGADVDGVVKYGISAFGLIGTATLLYAAFTGFVFDRWSAWLSETRTNLVPHIAAIPFALVLICGITGTGHWLVSARFVRPFFQHVGAYGFAVASGLIAFALWPVFVTAMQGVGRESAFPDIFGDVNKTTEQKFVNRLLIIPFGLLLIVGCTHFAFATFANETADAITLGQLAGSGAAIGALVAFVAAWQFARIFNSISAKLRLSVLLKIAAAGFGACLLVMISYGMTLQVIPIKTLLVAAFIGSIPLFLLAFGHKSLGSLMVSIGLGVLILGSFVLARNWSSADESVRTAVTGRSDLLAYGTKFLRAVDDGDGDGYANTFGGFDCDDTNKSIFPGADDVPGNEVDEDCSGADSQKIVKRHETYRLVSAAVNAARSESKKVSAKLPDPPKNVIVILVDTLRFDHLSVAGYERDTSPTLKKIADEGTLFTNAYATSPHTPRSIPAMFLSRYPSRTDWKGAQYNYPKVTPKNLSMFEVFKEAGYQTRAVSSHHYFQEKRGLGQGVDEWNNDDWKSIAESNDDIASPRTIAKLLPMLDAVKSKPEPFAFFIHLFEPHGRWIFHEKYGYPRGETTVEKHIAAYDSEIAYVDEQIAKIVAELKARNLYDNSVIVITSDHGEGFKEHGYFYHGQTLYNEVIHVPLIIRVPGWPSQTVETPVSIIDIAPTVVDLAGIPIPEPFEGISLKPGLIGDKMPKRPVFAELLPYTSWKELHRVVVDGDFKMIHVISKGAYELYDLKNDAGEKINIVAERPEVAKRLKQHLEAFRQK